jgi:hypothetical protein
LFTNISFSFQSILIIEGLLMDEKFMQYEAQSWRELLGHIISDPQEKQRLIDELDVSSITLTRWVNGETEPRPHNIRHLLSILSEYRDLFLHLLNKEDWFHTVALSTTDLFITSIPSEFYTRILLTRATTMEHVRNWSLCQLILQHALQQLDPEYEGIALWVVLCMPLSGLSHKVRSLRETIGMGTPPWNNHLEQMGMFLGAESLAGNVVTLCRPAIIQNLDEEHNLIPTTKTEFEKSSAIYPILFGGRISGVFMVSSTQINSFLSLSRTTLIQQYADLLALAFEPEDFFAPEQVALGVMPSHEEQKKHFAHFRQLVTETLRLSASQHQPLTPIEADLLVWQKLEEKLLSSLSGENTYV